MTTLLNLFYGAIQGSYWMYYGAVLSFASVFLLGKGYTNSEIGVILAAANILAVLIQPLLADAADRSKRISLIHIVGSSSIGLAAATLSLYLFPVKAIALSVLFVIIAALHTSLQPLVNSMAFYLGRSGYRINFGIARSGGSIAYAVLCAILGTLVTIYGINAIPVTGVLMLAFLLIFLSVTSGLLKKALPSQEVLKDKTSEEKGEAINLLVFVKRNMPFIMFSIGIMFVFFQNSVLNTYLLQIITEVGGTSSQLGRLFSFMALLEIPGLFFFSKIRSRFSCQFLLKLSSVAFVLKIFLVFLADTVSFIYLAYLFQLISFPIFLSAAIHLVDEVMEKGEAVKGQSFVTGMITMSTVFASLLGGVILDISGASLLLIISTATCVFGTMIVFFSVDRIRRKQQNRHL
ncbi:MFS transporter [Anoxybacterium hadale]|uniref:MFS transporter n=1 Tax=Anoxybacterium hadale TaxID=3408580 RepID=A0ACD1ADA1_9FIRM|nr:MFS transporter [Clostridiales bacterium]